MRTQINRVSSGRRMVWMAGLVALMLAGCASNRAQQPQRTSVHFDDARRHLDAMGLQLQQTQAALNDLVRRPQADLRPQFARFEERFNLTRTSAQQLWPSVERMRSSGRAMMTAWDAELSKIDRHDLRELGRRRREAFGQRYDALDVGFRALRRDLDPYLAGLDDMLDFLRVDLNATSLADIRALAEDANDQAAVITRQVGELSELLQETAAAISPVTPTTQPVGTGR